MRRDAEHQPVNVKTLALAADAWHTVTWREGSNDDMTSRFTRIRVRPAHRDEKGVKLHPEEWLLVEWPEGRGGADQVLVLDPPRKHVSRRDGGSDQIALAHRTGLPGPQTGGGARALRGRGWRGFHHHATLCVAAYGFLISERETIPPLGTGSRPTIGQLGLSHHKRPRRAPDPPGTARPELRRDPAQTLDYRPRQRLATLSVLPGVPQRSISMDFMTQ